MLGFILIWFVCIGFVKPDITMSEINLAGRECINGIPLEAVELCILKATGIVDDDMKLNKPLFSEYLKVVFPDRADEIFEKCSSTEEYTTAIYDCVNDILFSYLSQR